MFSLASTPHSERWSPASRVPTTHTRIGFTLVELLIATTIALAFSGAMIRLYIDAKQSYALSNAKTLLNEDSRATFRLLGAAIAHAGYRNGRDITLTSTRIFPSDGTFLEDQVLRAQGQANGSWQLSTRFQGSTDALLRDCLGNTYLDDHLVTQVLRYDADTQALSCQVSCTVIYANHLTCPTESALIADTLHTFELLVGRDGGQQNRIPGEYQTIATFNGTETDVLSIKALAWFESPNAIYQQDTAQTLTAFSGAVAENDRQLRQVFTETFAVRNRLP